MKKRYLMLMIPMLVLSGCASLRMNDNKYSDEEIDEIIDDALDDVPVEVTPYEGDMNPLTLLDNIEQETSESLVKFHLGDEDQYVKVVDIEYHYVDAPMMSYGEYNPSINDVALVDENDNNMDLYLIESHNGETTFRIPVSHFEEYHNYHFKLLSEKVRFYSKEASIRQITYYSLDVTEANRRHDVIRTEQDIKTFDINNVEYFDVDAYSAYFIYKENFDIDPNVKDDAGKMFRLANTSINQDDQETVYGKLISCQKNPNGGGYIVRYEPCNGGDLYANLNVNDEIILGGNNAVITLEQEENGDLATQLGRAFAHHEDTKTAIKGILDHYNVEPNQIKGSMLDWATRVQISFNMKWDDSTSTFTWGATATLQINPEDNLVITLKLGYKQTIRYKVSASLSVEWTLFIPTGIKYKLEVTEDDTKEVEFGVMMSTNLAPYDEEKVKDAITDDILEAFVKNSDVKSKFKGDNGTSSQDGRSYPLFRIDCYYFWPLDIRFSIEFYWKCQLTLEANIKYTSHSQRVDVSIANSKGCDPHSETKATNDKAITINFMGNFHAEIGIKVTLGIGIVGFYRFFHAEVYICAYGAVDAQGFLTIGITWGTGREASFTGAMGGKFEVSVGVKWGVDIALLFGGYKFEWPIAKCVLLGFAHDAAINNFIDKEASVDLNDQDYVEGDDTGWIDLDDYHLLGVVIFDSKTYGSAYQDMKHDDNTKTKYGAWVDEKSERYFSFEVTEGSEYIELKDYKLRIKKIYGIESFDAKIKVTVNKGFTVTGDSRTTELTKIIKIHFENNLKQEIKVKDFNGNVSSVGTYVVGANCVLPVPEAPRYMKFVGWKNLADNTVKPYDPTDGTSRIYVPETTGEVTFEYIFEDDFYWSVVWVDGLGNIIKTENVMDGEDANAPTPEERDRYMESYIPGYTYIFMGYDKEYTNIRQNTVIRAMYELRRVSD